MNIKKFLILGITGLLLLGGAYYLGSNKTILGATILFPQGGGTGIGTATAGDVGKVLKVTDDSPFTYELATDATGAGGGTYPFTPITVGSRIYEATTSQMYFSGGFLTGTSTIGSLTATSSITFNGITSSTWAGFCETITGGAGLCDGTDATGGAGGSNPFSSLLVGGTVYQATTSPLYLSGGFITGTSTIGTLTATSSATFLAGLTITCTDCVTDANVADLAVGGDVTGTLSNIAVTDNSHAHDSTTISGLDSTDISGLDISADTNLAVTYPIVLTDDTVSLAWSYPWSYLSYSGTTTAATTTSLALRGGTLFATSSVTTFSTSTNATSTNLNVSNIFRLNSTTYASLDGAGLTTTGNALVVGAGTCITVNANDVAVTSNCTDAATVDSIEGASLLRSDASDSYTSGTLTFDAATTLSIAGTLNYTNSATSSFKGGILTSQGFDGLFASLKNLRIGDLLGTATSTITYDADGGGQLLMATSSRIVVLESGLKTVWSSGDVSSTTLSFSGFVAGQRLSLPIKAAPYALDHLACGLSSLTNLVVKIVHDNTKAETNQITCLTTGTTTPQRITVNGGINAYEKMWLEVVSISGTPGYAVFTGFGTTTPQ